MYTLKWSVLQYAIIHPAVSIVSIICKAYGVLGETCGIQRNSIYFANLYLLVINFISNT